MRLHPRTRPVERAKLDLREQLLTFQEEHDLTNVEMLQALTEAQQVVLKYMLREERHPGDPDRKADEA